MSILTAEFTLEKLSAGKTIKVCKVNPCGSLYARKAIVGAVTFSWRWTHAMVNDSENIGLWDPKAAVTKLEPTPAGWTVRAAVRQAETWALEHKAHERSGGFRAVLLQLQEAELRDKAAVEHHTLGHLMADYANLLKTRGSSDVDVRSATRQHIQLPHPELFNRPAKLVTQDDVMRIIAAVNTNDVYRRTSSKLRSFMLTAYNTALKASTQPNTPKHFRAYDITHNPVMTVLNPEAPKTAVKPIKALTLTEMRLYWSLVKDAPGMRGAVLRLHLLTGGQRPAQLVRLKTEDLDEDRFTLIDTKGRSARPRQHQVPLTELAAKALAECGPRDPYVLSINGEMHINKRMICDWAQDAVGDKIADFKLKWVRSGVKTLLSNWHIDKQTLGRLQSHGFGGVQDVHYDASEYHDRKLEALELLEYVLTTPAAKPPKSTLVAQLRANDEAAAKVAAFRAIPTL